MSSPPPTSSLYTTCSCDPTPREECTMIHHSDMLFMGLEIGGTNLSAGLLDGETGALIGTGRKTVKLAMEDSAREPQVLTAADVDCTVCLYPACCMFDQADAALKRSVLYRSLRFMGLVIENGNTQGSWHVFNTGGRCGRHTYTRT